MKYKFIFAAAVLFLTACTPTHENSTNKYSLPPELADCKVFTLLSANGGIIHVVRCPKAESISANHNSGKVIVTNVLLQ